MNNMPNHRTDIRRGLGSAERPVTAELWARDSQEKSPAMLEPGNYEPAHQQVDFKRYYNAE